MDIRGLRMPSAPDSPRVVYTGDQWSDPRFVMV
jgi:hypothetical protein